MDIANYFNKQNPRELYFFPVYTCPDLKKVIIGKKTLFDKDKPFEEERERIIRYLQTEITNMANSLPSFTITPYRSI